MSQTLTNVLQDHPVIIFLGAIVTGFVSGITAYRMLLTMTNQTTIVRGTYILKSQVVGRVLRQEVLTELRRLIDIGKDIDASVKPEVGEAYLTRIEVFVRNLDLPKVRQFGGEKMSVPAYTMQLLMMDNKIYGYGNLTLRQKVSRVLGILQGLESSFAANAGIEQPDET